MAGEDKSHDAMLRLDVTSEEAGGDAQAYATVRVRGDKSGWKDSYRIPLRPGAEPFPISVPSGVYSVDVLLPSGKSLSETGRIDAGADETVRLGILQTSTSARDGVRASTFDLESLSLESLLLESQQSAPHAAQAAIAIESLFPESEPESEALPWHGDLAASMDAFGTTAQESESLWQAANVKGAMAASPLESVSPPWRRPSARPLVRGSVAASEQAPAPTLAALLGDTAALRFWQYRQGRWEPVVLPIAQSVAQPQRAVFVLGEAPAPLLLAELRGSNGKGAYFCRVPTSWRNRRGGAVDVTLDVWIGPSINTGRPKLRVQAVVADPELAALCESVAYGAGNDPFDLGETIAADAGELLSEKHNNPWLATAAALALLKSGRRKSLQAWTLNLADQFEFLPDGAIVAAWNILYSEQRKGPALDLLQRASARGLPLFTESLRLLVSGLRLFGPEYDEDAGRWERYLWATRGDATFTSFFGANPASPGEVRSDSGSPDVSGAWVWKTR